MLLWLDEITNIGFKFPCVSVLIKFKSSIFKKLLLWFIMILWSLLIWNEQLNILPVSLWITIGSVMRLLRIKYALELGMNVWQRSVAISTVYVVYLRAQLLLKKTKSNQFLKGIICYKNQSWRFCQISASGILELPTFRHEIKIWKP